MDSLRKMLVMGLAATIGFGLYAGRPFTKPISKKSSSTKAESNGGCEVLSDTLFSPSAESVTVSGFEKTLRANKESMYVTNNTADTIEGLNLEITYSDVRGRMLHRAQHDVTALIPSGETRMVQVPSFDRQSLYYYYLSPLPKRADRATPFKVRVEIKSVIVPKKSEK